MTGSALPRPTSVTLAVGVIVAYAWWVTALTPFTWPALVAVEAGGIAAMALGARQRRAREPTFHAARGTLVWGLLVALLAAWELIAYVQHPRADHPTLSSLFDHLLDWHPARAVAFVVWLVVGADLARR